MRRSHVEHRNEGRYIVLATVATVDILSFYNMAYLSLLFVHCFIIFISGDT